MKIAEEHIKMLHGEWREKNPLHKSTAIYQDIYAFIKSAIAKHDLPNASELPATRKLATALQISRSTVVKAYELLRLEGLLTSKTGAGHFVHFEQADNLDFVNPAEVNLPEISEIGRSFYGNVNLVNSLDDKTVAFRPGIPPLDIFPIHQWKKQTNKYWQFAKASELSYYAETGVEALKKSIASYLLLTSHVKCDFRQIVIVSGSLQSLYLIGSLLINPGDGVYMENPTFPNVHSVYKGLRADVVGVDLDADGINIAQVANDSKANMKLLHVTPSCQYPMSMAMTLARKQEVLAFAKKKGVYIIENDYEHEINNFKAPRTPLFTLDKEQRTFYLGTFNRSLHPSIRIGFMVVPPQLIDPMRALIRHSHLFVSPSIQFILNSLIENKILHKHLAKVQEVAEERYSLFSSIIKNQGQGVLKEVVSKVPSLHITTLLNKNVSDKNVVDALGKKGIITHSLSKCYVSEPKQQGLIMGHSCIRTPLIKAKLQKLLGTIE
jgi:GntR family transcriptional regulator/MocR family aminotransferase